MKKRKSIKSLNRYIRISFPSEIPELDLICNTLEEHTGGSIQVYSPELRKNLPSYAPTIRDVKDLLGQKIDIQDDRTGYLGYLGSKHFLERESITIVRGGISLKEDEKNLYLKYSIVLTLQALGGKLQRDYHIPEWVSLKWNDAGIPEWARLTPIDIET